MHNAHKTFVFHVNSSTCFLQNYKFHGEGSLLFPRRHAVAKGMFEGCTFFVVRDLSVETLEGLLHLRDALGEQQLWPASAFESA